MGVRLQPEKHAAVFHEQGAVEALLEMLAMFRSDEVFLRQAVETLIPLCEQDGERFFLCTCFVSCEQGYKLGVRLVVRRCPRIIGSAVDILFCLVWVNILKMGALAPSGTVRQ